MSDIEDALKDDQISTVAKKYADDIIAKKIELADFVGLLGPVLTSTDTEIRVKAMDFLSTTLTNLPNDFLNQTELEFISTFYSDRFKDHHSVIPNTLSGTETLIKMTNLTNTCAVRILQAIFQNVSCQSQLRPDRLKIYNIISELSESKTQALLNMGSDFVYGFINAMDGERDPRLLVYIYDFFPKFVSRFPLGHLAQETFEVVACYFPIDFNPVRNESEDITREQLAEKLSDCLCGHEEFAGDCLDLLLEKLDSDLSVAKLDSIHLLIKASQKFPPKVFDEQFANIWRIMQADLLPGINKDITVAALNALQLILINIEKDETVSTNILSFVLAKVQPWFADVDSRMFMPSVAIALKCSEATKLSAKMVAQRCLTDFLTQMSPIKNDHDDDAESVKVTGRDQRGTLIELSSQLIATCIRYEVVNEIDEKLLEAAQIEFVSGLEPNTPETEKFIKISLQALAITAPIVNNDHRIIVYEKVNGYLLESIDTTPIDCSNVLSSFGARFPDEVSSNIVNHLMDIDHISKKLSPAAIAELFKMLCCLIPLRKFREEILEFLFHNIFDIDDPTKNFIRLIGVRVLHHVLENDQNEELHSEMYVKYNIFDRFIALIHSKKFDVSNAEQLTANDDILYEMSQILRIVMVDLDAKTQKELVEKHLTSLDLQLKADLYFALGLLGYLEASVDLENHFEHLVDELMQLSLKAGDEDITKISNQLLCTLFNKCPDDDHHNNILKKIIRLIRAELDKHNKKAVEILSWLSKGLMTRGHPLASELINILIDLLNHKTLKDVALDAFELLSAEFPQLHLPVIKHFFQQKIFQICLKGLWHHIELYLENDLTEHHISALAFILKMTPHQVIRNNIEKTGSVLLNCLEVKNEKVLLTVLTIISRLIAEQEEYFRDHISGLIPICITLSKHKGTMKIRLAAIQILSAVTKQYTSYFLVPHAQDVVLGLRDALDDRKRLVRTAAVLARNQWYLVGSEK